LQPTHSSHTRRCLIHNHDDLDPGCKKELGRAVHMAFFIWSAGATLTAPCDDDVAALCLKARPNMDAVPGAVGSCLADIVSVGLLMLLVVAGLCEDKRRRDGDRHAE
jgi:hypothetical protein